MLTDTFRVQRTSQACSVVSFLPNQRKKIRVVSAQSENKIRKDAERQENIFFHGSLYLLILAVISAMNRDMNSFLAEQAMLLANNSVSLTQISRPLSLATNNKHQNIQNQPSPVSTPTPRDMGVQSSPSSSSNLSKYSQLLLVLEEMSKDIR